MGLLSALKTGVSKLRTKVREYRIRYHRERALRAAYGEKYPAIKSAIIAGLVSPKEVEEKARKRLLRLKPSRRKKKTVKAETFIPVAYTALAGTRTKKKRSRRKRRRKRR